ncbi:cytidine deaminase-like protein [Naematelia encephala]|uniref:Deoxycytidylate deaminase n=1 Tax=Naematelia encephala TaxID=71784 RepID=A0A1Y2BCK9_9TREE|nr:cytidine deaminase-like protein [Naematelia encephala]
MFIAIVGTPSAGKATVLEYLERKHGFKTVGLEGTAGMLGVGESKMTSSRVDVSHMNGLSISGSSTSVTTSVESPISPSPTSPSPSPRIFSSATALLDYMTRNWLDHHVTTDLRTYDDIELFLKRPSFLLVFVDGPVRARFERERQRSLEARGKIISLDEFIDQHDLLYNGPSSSTCSSSNSSSSSSSSTTNTPSTSTSTSTSLSSTPASSSSSSYQQQTDLTRLARLATVTICNNLSTLLELETYLDQLNLVDEERLRPGWDTYFMTLASLASHRSNCMKRRVGALLVRSKRILSTGYNGTPRGTKNCNQGGCSRCNGTSRGGESLATCLCLHAEENALLEAGRERIGTDSVLYCNTCPCLTCSVKIVQCGVREVVYNQSYSMDELSATVLKEGGVILRQLHMPI